MAASGAPPTSIYRWKSIHSYYYDGVSSVPISSTTHPQKKQKTRRCDCFDLSKELIPYEKAWSWQKLIVKERQVLIEKNEDFADTLLILQHHPVYTLGTSSSEEYLNFNIMMLLMIFIGLNGAARLRFMDLVRCSFHFPCAYCICVISLYIVCVCVLYMINVGYLFSWSNICSWLA